MRQSEPSLCCLLCRQVDLESRKVVDRHVIGGDCVELSRHQGVHLYQDLLLVLGVSQCWALGS